MSISPYIDFVSGTIHRTSEALGGAIELSLKRSNHAAESFGRSNQHRFVDCRTPTWQFSRLGHPTLLSRGQLPFASR